MRQKKGCFATKILSLFDYSIRLWYNNYAVAYRCKFFRKTSCCLNSEYLLFTTACLNFKDHDGRNSLLWNSLSWSFSKVCDCWIQFWCACGICDLVECIFLTPSRTHCNIEYSWTTVNDSVNNCTLAVAGASPFCVSWHWYTSTVGAGALIPYKRGDDDVGWFISYSHS